MAKTTQPIRTPDSLFSDDHLEVVLGLSEGPIKGLKNGTQSFFLGETPLSDGAGRPTIGNFDLAIHKGVNPAPAIKQNLGGSGSSFDVGVALVTDGQTITRTCQQTNIDFIDVRMVISGLAWMDGKGNDLPAYMAFDILVKPHSAPDWSNAIVPGLPLTNSDNSSLNKLFTASDVGTVINSGYTEVYGQSAQPTGAGVGAIWFKIDATNGSPRIYNGSAWVTPANLTGSVQGSFYVWSFVDLQDTVRKAYWTTTGAVPSDANLSPLDFLVSPTGVSNQSSTPQTFVWNGSSFVDSMTWNAPPTSNPGTQIVYGHVSANYSKNYRIPVPRINEVYDVRVIRRVQASSSSYRGDFSWESVQEISATPRAYDDLALAHLTLRSSDQFSSLPSFEGEYEGRIIRVPTNYDPVAKTYTGIWDGLFKNAYDDNPAWIAYDLVMNTRYGMNAYFPVVLDRWDTYSFARHCTHYGFTFNEYIKDAQNLKSMADYIVGVAGGRLIDRMDGFLTILFDAADTPAVAQFSAENVIDGLFSYSFTDINERKNDLTVSFVNPELNWREDRIRVFNQESIDAYGRNPEEFIAVGCIDPVEAVKRARLRLATAVSETTIVNFKTNRVGLYISPFEVITIADPDMGDGIGGRIHYQPTQTELTLRDPIYLEPGYTYEISFQIPNGDSYALLTRTIAPTSGEVTSLTLTAPLGRWLPDYAQFTISQATKVGVPKAYRIVNIDEPDDDPDNVSITAIEVNRLKWPYVNGEVDARDLTNLISGIPSGFVFPVSDLRVLPSTATSGQQNLTLAWTKSPTLPIRGYRVYEQVNNGTRLPVSDTIDTTLTVYDVVPSTYLYTVVAIGPNGQESPPSSIIHVVSGSGSVSAVAPPTNLALKDEVAPGVFTNLSPTITWTASTSPFVAGYEVQVINPTTLAVLRTEFVEGTSYTYLYESNRADNVGTPRRNVRFSVRTKTNDNFTSSAAVLNVANPSPAAPSFTTTPAIGVSTVLVSTPTDLDFRGVLVWVSTNPSFNPLVTTPYYDGPNTEVLFPCVTGTMYYVRVAAYDAFGKTDLNVSPTQSVTSIKVKGVDITQNAIDAFHLANNIIDETKLATSIPLLKNYATAPSIFSGQTITVGTNPARLYSWNGTAYVATLQAADLVGTISNLQIAELNAAKLTGTIVGTQIGDNAITTPKIAAGAVVTANLAAGAVTASKLLIADTTNMLLNGNFSVPGANVPSAEGWTTYGDTYVVSGSGSDGGPEYYTNNTNHTYNVMTEVEVQAGCRYYLKVDAYNSRSQQNAFMGLQVGIFWLDASKVQIGAVHYLPGSNVRNAWVTLEARTDEAPPGARYARVLFFSNWQTAGSTNFGRALMRQAQKSLMIVQGAIVTEHMTAGSINADRLVVNSITAAQIQAGAIGAQQIAAGAIIAEKLGVGTGQNLVFNSDFNAGDIPNRISDPQGGAVYTVLTQADFNGDYCPVGMRAGQIYHAAFATNALTVHYIRNPVADGTWSFYGPCKAGQRYELSGYLSASNCYGYLVVAFYDVAGNYISQALTPTQTGDEYLVRMPNSARRGVFVTAPANAASFNVYVAKMRNGPSNSYLRYTGLMFAPAQPNQTTYSEWVPYGGTIVTGSMIQARTIKAIQLEANTITGNEIAALTINANNIAAGAITVDKLSVNSLSAISANLGNLEVTGGGITFRNGIGYIRFYDMSGP